MNPQYVNVFTLVHFLLWFMIGILFPNRLGLAIVLSVLWEFVEGYVVQHPILYQLMRQYWFIPEKYWNEGIGNKITDIIANLAGYSIVSTTFVSRCKSQAFYIAFLLWISAILYAKYSNAV